MHLHIHDDNLPLDTYAICINHDTRQLFAKGSTAPKNAYETYAQWGNLKAYHIWLRNKTKTTPSYTEQNSSLQLLHIKEHPDIIGKRIGHIVTSHYFDTPLHTYCYRFTLRMNNRLCTYLIQLPHYIEPNNLAVCWYHLVQQEVFTHIHATPTFDMLHDVQMITGTVYQADTKQPLCTYDELSQHRTQPIHTNTSYTP